MVSIIKKLKNSFFFPLGTHRFHSTSFVGSATWKTHIIRPEEGLFAPRILFPSTEVDEAIGDLPGDFANDIDEFVGYKTSPFSMYQELLRNRLKRVSDHIGSGIQSITKKRIACIPEGGNWTDLPISLQPNNLKSYKKEAGAFRGRYGRLDRKKCFSTIVTKPEPYWGRFIHLTKNRLLSIRECARAQSFPDSFQFYGSVAARYRQIGNAVPPLLAFRLGESLQFPLGLASTPDIKEAYGQSQQT